MAFILSIQTEASLLVLAKSIHYCYSGEVESGGCVGETGREGGGVLEAGEDRAAGEEGEMGDITQKWSIFCNRKKG